MGHAAHEVIANAHRFRYRCAAGSTLMRINSLVLCAGVAIVLSPMSLAHIAGATLPATSCDAALAAPDLHFPVGMSPEGGSTAFTYSSGGRAFVSTSGNTITITMSLRFEPTPGTMIAVAALDETC